jgi:hypothetical protein
MPVDERRRRNPANAALLPGKEERKRAFQELPRASCGGGQSCRPYALQHSIPFRLPSRNVRLQLKCCKHRRGTTSGHGQGHHTACLMVVRAANRSAMMHAVPDMETGLWALFASPGTYSVCVSKSAPPRHCQASFSIEPMTLATPTAGVANGVH